MPRHLLALASSITLIAGVGIALAPAALADDPPAPDTSSSHASAQFLSGKWNTSPATADYFGNGTSTPDPAVEDSEAIGSDTFSDNGVAVDGALGSAFAHAGTGGSSWAASGWVTGTGDGGAAKPASVNIDLLQALGINSNDIEQMQLSLQKISSIAKLDLSDPNSGDSLANGCGDVADWATATNCRGYTLQSGKFHLESSAIAKLAANVKGLAAQIDASIGTLTANLPDAVTDVLVAPAETALQAALVGKSVGPSLLTLGNKFEITSASLGDPTVTVAASGTVLATLASKLTGPHSANGVTIDLDAGTIDVDYGTFMGGLNNLGPNTPLFGPDVASNIQASVNSIIDSIAAEIAAAIPDLLAAIHVSVTASATPSATVTTTPYTYVAAHHEGGTLEFNQICNWGICLPDLTSGHWVGGVDVPAAWVPNGSATDTDIDGLTVTGNYAGTLWDVLNGGAVVSLGFDNWPHALSDLHIDPPNIGSITLPGLPGGISQPIIDSAAAAASAAVKAFVDPAIAGAMDALNSASSVFSGTINAQSGNADDGYQVSALVLQFGSPSPLRSGSAFAKAASPAAIRIPPVTIRLATSIVGQNQASTTCPAGTHYDPKARPTCVKDSTPTVPAGGGGTPTTTTPPATTTTSPTTEVLGSSDTTTSPSVTVKGESNEAPQTTQVLGLAETGPHDVALIAVLGLELLLGGIAIIRLTARRRRELTDQHHV